MCPTFPARLPLPISTLHFTTDNLLDTLLVDVVQPHQHQHHHQTLYRPRYAIETIEDETSVYQLVSSTTTPNEKSSLVGCIKWHPKHAHPTFVSAFNQTVAASDFLKKSVLGGTRKFHVPGQSSPLKWKHVGNRYECTLCSHACTAHRAVAIFDPPRPTRRQTAGSLSLYVSSIASDHINGGEFEIDHDGDLVDPTLLVHLILTCILIAHPHHAPSRTHTRSAIEHRHHVKSQTIPIQHSQPHSHSSPSHSANKSLSKCALKCGPIEVNTVKERIDLIGDEDGDDMETSLGGGGSSRAPSSPFSPFSPVTITTSSHTSMPSPMLHPSSPTMLYPPSPNMYPPSHSHSPLMPPSPLYPASHLPANVSIVVPSPGSTSSHTCSLPASPITPISSSASSSSHHNCQSHPRSSPRGGFIEPIAAINSETFTSSQTNNYAATTHTHTHAHAHTNNHHNHNHNHHQHHLSQHREYAPTPTRPPTSSTASMFATMSGQMYAFAHAMGRSRSNGSSTSKRNNNGSGSNNSSTHNLASTSVPSGTTIGHKVHRTSSSSSTGHRGTTNPGGPRSSSSSGPRSATSCFFNFHPKPGNNNNNSATNTYNGTNNSSTNNLNGTGAEMAPGPNAITPYYLPPAPVHPPPPVPPPLQVQIMQPVGTSGSPSRNALLLDTRSPITTSGGTIASPSALTTPLPPSPMIRYTTEMYHLQFSDSALPPPPASPTLAAYDDSTMMMHYSNQHHNYGPTTTSSPLMLSVPIPPSSPVRVRGMTTTGSSTLPPSPLVIPLAPPPPLPIHSATTLSTMSPNSYSSSAATTTTTATSTAHTSPTSASTITSPTSPTTTAANANVSSPTRPIRIFQEVPAPTSWDELPPAYSEIEWTIRVREPRRGRQQQQRTHNGEEEEERRRGAGGGLQLVTV